MPKLMRICSGNTNVLVCVWHGWETVDKTETNVESCKTQIGRGACGVGEAERRCRWLGNNRGFGKFIGNPIDILLTRQCFEWQTKRVYAILGERFLPREVGAF